MRRFIYKKVTTAMPIFSQAYIRPTEQPLDRRLRHNRYEGYFCAGTADAAETITLDKWFPTTPFTRPHRRRREFDAFYPDTLFELGAAPTAPALDSWFIPVVGPRDRVSRLSPALMTSGNVSGFVPPSTTVGDASYKLKLFSRSRKTDL
jgi:hypothetical protein